MEFRYLNWEEVFRTWENVDMVWENVVEYLAVPTKNKGGSDYGSAYYKDTKRWREEFAKSERERAEQSKKETKKVRLLVYRQNKLEFDNTVSLGQRPKLLISNVILTNKK